MSFSKSSNLEAKSVLHFKLCYEITVFIRPQFSIIKISKTKLFRWVLCKIKENFKLKTKLIIKAKV